MSGRSGSEGSGQQDGPVDRGGASLEELADLHAGLLTQDEERTLRARTAHDPDAATLLAALEQVRHVLGALDDEPVPEDVAARIDAAIAAGADFTSDGG